MKLPDIHLKSNLANFELIEKPKVQTTKKKDAKKAEDDELRDSQSKLSHKASLPVSDKAPLTTGKKGKKDRYG